MYAQTVLCKYLIQQRRRKIAKLSVIFDVLMHNSTFTLLGDCQEMAHSQKSYAYFGGVFFIKHKKFISFKNLKMNSIGIDSVN